MTDSSQPVIRTTDENVPVLDKEGEHWVLKVSGAGPVRIPLENRMLAQHVWNAATHAYHNGRRDQRIGVLKSLGIDP